MRHNSIALCESHQNQEQKTDGTGNHADCERMQCNQEHVIGKPDLRNSPTVIEPRRSLSNGVMNSIILMLICNAFFLMNPSTCMMLGFSMDTRLVPKQKDSVE
jgi:hypothetical protein